MEAASSTGPQGTSYSFLESLRDTRFNELITPKIIRFLYILFAILIAIGVVVAIIAAFANDAGSGVLTLILAPIVGLLWLILARVYLELVIVAFKIREAAETIAENTAHR